MHQRKLGRPEQEILLSRIRGPSRIGEGQGAVLDPLDHSRKSPRLQVAAVERSSGECPIVDGVDPPNAVAESDNAARRDVGCGEGTGVLLAARSLCDWFPHLDQDGRWASRRCLEKTRAVPLSSMRPAGNLAPMEPCKGGSSSSRLDSIYYAIT